MKNAHIFSRAYIGLSVLVFITLPSGCISPKAALEEARSADTILAYEAFLERFGRSPQAFVARHRIAELRLDQARAQGDRVVLAELSADPNADRTVRAKARATLTQMNFDALVAGGNKAELEAYIRDNPRSQLRSRAQKALDDLIFRQAQQSSSVEALKAYLEKYPRGSHVDEAADLIEQRVFSACQETDSYEAWLEFLDRYPNSARASAARQHLEVLEAPRIAALMVDLDVNAIDQWGGSRLHEAAFTGDLLLAKALIRKGIDVNARISRTGIAPLHVAALHDHGSVVQVLLDNGADPNAADKLGSYPLDFAPSGGTAAGRLKASKASVNRVIHEPLFKVPPGGFAKYDYVANIVIMRMGSGPSYYFNRHGRSPKLSSTAGGAVVFDVYSRQWRNAVNVSDPYSP